MPNEIVIFSTTQTGGLQAYEVYWTGVDGYLRRRTFRSMCGAKKFAMQLECRLAIEEWSAACDRLTATVH